MSQTPHDPHDHLHHDVPQPTNPPAPGALNEQDLDPASRSLAEALRVSFRLLTVLMVLVVLAFLATGIRTIEPNERGIVLRFGRIVGVAEPGLVFAWPWPIGQVESIATGKERMTDVSAFWMHETPEQKTQTDLSARQAASGGLRPGWDGALFTGDRSLYHIKLRAYWRISDPVAFRTHVGNVEQAEQLLRSILSRAIVHTAASVTTDGLQRGGTGQLVSQADPVVRDLLADARAGIALKSFEVTQGTVPLQALGAYKAAQQAGQDRIRLIDEARGNALRSLQETAGASFPYLVASEWLGSDAEELDAEQQALIDQYIAARDAGQTDQAGQLLARIETVLAGNRTGGAAAEMISQARSYRDALVQRVEARAQRFARLSKIEDQQMLRQRLWADTREEILSGDSVEKYYYDVGEGRTVIYLNRDPETVKEINRRLREFKTQQRQEEYRRRRQQR